MDNQRGKGQPANGRRGQRRTGRNGGNGGNDGRRLKDYYFLAFQKCIVGSAHTYKVQEGHNGKGIRKEPHIRLQICVFEIDYTL